MLPIDIDKISEERINVAAKKIGDGDRIPIEDIFTSEKFISALDGEINLMRSYVPTEVMAMLPFSASLLVSVCPYCVTESRLSNFKKFVERGAIIPILTAPYKAYSGSLVDFVSSHDHVSAYEYGFYKQFVLRAEAEGWVCNHCIEKSMGEALGYVGQEKNFENYKFLVDRIGQNLWPFVRPDADLVDSVLAVCKKKDVEELMRLQKVSEGVSAVRESQIFDAPILLRSDEFDLLPKGILSDGDEAKSISAEMKKFALEGLGLRIPSDIDINEYVELVSDFRPALTKIVSDVTAPTNAGNSAAVSMVDVQKEVMRINSEIERIKGLRRTVVLDACVGFYRDHPKLVTTSLIMCALGLSDHFIGCAVAGGAQATRGVIQALGGKKEAPETARLRSIVERDVMPVVGKLISAYVGTDERTVSVLSLRKTIEGRVARSKRGSATSAKKPGRTTLKDKLSQSKKKIGYRKSK